MSALIRILEQQGKREFYSQHELQAGGGDQALWETLQILEKEAERFNDMIQAYLPKNTQLKRQSVKLDTYEKPKSKSVVKLRAQIAASNHRSYFLRIHCHEIDSKGRYIKLARAEYHYQENKQI